ncbi:MAG: hypothetical protein ACYCWW_09425 [Deltaproteobacteria bacterium]
MRTLTGTGLAAAFAIGLWGCNGGGDRIVATPDTGNGATTGNPPIFPSLQPPPPIAVIGGGGILGDGGAPDAGTVAGRDAGPTGTAKDAGQEADGGPARSDAGVTPPDAGAADAGTPPSWPDQPLTVYGPNSGIQELPVVGAQPDEAQNLWVVTHQALYLLRPGQTTFHRYTDADGLHLALSQPPGITAVAGGSAGQAYVGYEGWVDGTPNQDTQAQKDMGKLDQVTLNPDGTLTVFRFNVHDSDSINYWENRSVRRLLYDHTFHPGDLYVGFNHGVDRINGDSYADHVHPEVCLGGCSNPQNTEMIGEWRGLAFDAKHGGAVWMGGEYTAGLLGWTSNLMSWIDNSANPFIVAFGDPYPPSQPVFEPPQEGDSVDIRAIAVTPDGLVWFASGPEWSDSDPQYGIASYAFSSGGFTYYDPMSLGFGTKALMDMVALPDGRLVFGTEYDGLRIWTPQNGQLFSMTVVDGLPGNQIQMMYLDTSVSPPALYVGTDGGLAVLRIQKP